MDKFINKNNDKKEEKVHDNISHIQKQTTQENNPSEITKIIQESLETFPSELIEQAIFSSDLKYDKEEKMKNENILPGLKQAYIDAFANTDVDNLHDSPRTTRLFVPEVKGRYEYSKEAYYSTSVNLPTQKKYIKGIGYLLIKNEELNKNDEMLSFEDTRYQIKGSLMVR